MAVEMEIVRHESPARIYGVESDPALHSDCIEELKIYEVFDVRDDIETSNCIGDYKIVVEFTVASIEELNEKKNVAKNTIELLDKLWIYVTAYPLTITDYS